MKTETTWKNTTLPLVTGRNYLHKTTGKLMRFYAMDVVENEIRLHPFGDDWIGTSQQFETEFQEETHPMDRPWIGVDLDGTLAHYDEWRGIEHIGPPIEAMRLRVRQWLDEGQEVRILTARVGPQRHDMPHTIAEITQHIEAWCLTHLGQVLRVTSQKDYCMVAFWDDRCVQVVPNTGRSLETELAAANAHIMAQREELLLLRTWNQRALNAIHPDAKVTTNPDSLRGLTLIPDGIPIAAERDTQIGIEAELRKRLAEAERDAEVLATILSRVLDSSRPHPVDHPSMHREWASARVGLTAYEMKKAKPVLETAE